MAAGYDPIDPTDAGRAAPRPPRLDPPAAYQHTGVPYQTAAAGYPQTPPYQSTGSYQTTSWQQPAPYQPMPERARPRRRSPLAVTLVVLLALVVGVQSFFLIMLQQRLGAANRRAVANRSADARRVDALDGRIKALEQRAAQSLDSAAVATAVLPSVFRVDAGQFTGTAFAVGKAAAGGGTNLLTNYHVVAEVYATGGRDVALRHDSERFPAKIVRVDKTQDLALLHSDQSFPRLAAAGKQAQSGTPIIVIGAPLGLAQSVTSGIVSAVRSDVPGEAGRTFIQFSAPINPGNSGGPVVDAQKQVVGIASEKAPDAEGIGLAIPINVACESFTIC